MKVLVLGSNGQLGTCIAQVSMNYLTDEYTFLSHKQLDVTDGTAVYNYFNQRNFDVVVNCSAYTKVSGCDDNIAMKVNFNAVENLLYNCKRKNCWLIHISTDYVFDGEKGLPYVEDDQPNPLNGYGLSKWFGEKHIIKSNYDKVIILRTSWLYSTIGKNFFTFISDMLSRGVPGIAINTKAVGSPTYAKDLAEAICRIIYYDKLKAGLYHYANEGSVSWIQFAEEISKHLVRRKIAVEYVKYGDTEVKKPKYSVLNCDKFKETFDMKINTFENSLERCIKTLKRQ